MPVRDDDASALRGLGYAQELLRSLGGFSSFALGFSVISILTGVITAFDIGLTGGGPAGLGLGWPIVSVGTVFVALGMAELASAFPTAGGTYHWAARLGGPGMGWFVAWMNVVGQIAIVAAIDLGCAQQVAAVLGWSDRRAALVFLAIVTSHGVVNAARVKLVAYLNDLSATVHLAGVFALVGALLLFGAVHPVGYLARTGFTTRPDGDYTTGFLSALLLGMWTMTGFDAPAHVSEETHDASRKAPLGVLSSVVVSGIAGFALVAALTLAIQDLPATAADPHPALFILRHALGAGWGSWALALAIAAMWFCGLSAVTSLSRTLFAFARDGGLPGSNLLSRVGANGVPERAVAAATVLPLVLGLGCAALPADSFLAVASLATTALYVSYGLPIALGAAARRRGTWKDRGPFDLGRWGLPIACAAVAWTVFVLGVAALPRRGLYLGVLACVAAVLALSYVLFVKGRFHGPSAPPAGNAAQPTAPE